MAFSLCRWFVATVAVLSLVGNPCFCWDQEELDLFDLVEDIGMNFYDLMQIDQDASASDIRRAYRQLSLQLHPDKSDDPDAAEKFRKMVAVTEVLKDEVTREMYDIILEEGLPDWKEPLFYYRKMRKMGFLELSIMLVMALSVGHYLYGWAVYAEKQIVLQDRLSRKQKKVQRKSKHAKSSLSQQRLEAELEMLHSEAQACIPHFKDLLPILLAKNLFWFSLLGLKILHKKWEMVLSTSANTHDGQEEGDSKKGKSNLPKKPVGGTERRESGASKEGSERDGSSKASISSEQGSERDGSDGTSTSSDSSATKEGGERDTNKNASFSNGSCATKEGSERDTNKNASFSNVSCASMENGGMDGNGSPDDHSLSSEDTRTMEPSQKELDKDRDISTSSTDGAERNGTKESPKTHTSKDKAVKVGRKGRKAKSTVRDLYTVINNQPEDSLSLDSKITSPPTQRDTSLLCGEEGEGDGGWSQLQQRQLEQALIQFPKFSSDRWINIARCIPDKSQEDCIVRCKQIYEELKRKKAS